MAESPDPPTSDVACFVFRPGSDRAQVCSLSEALAAVGENDAKVWINLLSPTTKEFQVPARHLGFHELAVEDVFSPQSHAKVESYPGQLFGVIPALNLTTSEDEFDVVNLNAFLSRNYLVTAQRCALPTVTNAKEWMHRSAEMLQRGPDFLLYRLLDGIVDEYIELSDQMMDRVDGLEMRIFGTADNSISEEIFELRSKSAWLRRLISPQREILNVLTNRPHDYISRETQLYLRDVYDHVQRVRENTEIFHDLLQGAMETYLTLVANRTNEVMKVLAAVGTVVLPINMLTGLYGTNFEILPGSGNPWGFWVFCAALLLTATAMVLLFRARKWF